LQPNRKFNNAAVHRRAGRENGMGGVAVGPGKWIVWACHWHTYWPISFNARHFCGLCGPTKLHFRGDCKKRWWWHRWELKRTGRTIENL